MSTSSRLRELGHELPPVAAPVAAYVPARRHGAVVQTSGQLPIQSGGLAATGKVGNGPGHVEPEAAADLARVCALNALAAAAEAAGGLDNVVGVQKLTGFVASAPDFAGQPAVINGASTFYGELFGERGVHTRSAVGVAVLPLDAPVEIEVTFDVA